MEPRPSKVTYTYDGEIHYDHQTEGKFPIVKMTDRSYSWEELGRFLMSYEGFKIKIEIID